MKNYANNGIFPVASDRMLSSRGKIQPLWQDAVLINGHSVKNNKGPCGASLLMRTFLVSFLLLS